MAVCSPILGTFYRAPSPGEKPFVEVGQKVAVNDTIGLIEVMKLFNSVKAEVGGYCFRLYRHRSGVFAWSWARPVGALP